LTTEQRERRLNQLLIFKQRNNDDVTSSDGSLTVPLVARVASKPGQRKRPLRKNLYIFIKQMSFVNKNNKVFFINKRRLFYTNFMNYFKGKDHLMLKQPP
jgi:hypothetical protein